MKYRKILLSIRLWFKLRRARKELSLLNQALEDLTEDSRVNLDIQKKFYEKQLAVERARNETLHTEWANRFLQLQKLSTLGISSSLIEEKALLKLPEVEFAPELSLTSSQQIELEERKELFFNQGLEFGKDISEIHNRWRDIEPDIISQVRLAIT